MKHLRFSDIFLYGTLFFTLVLYAHGAQAHRYGGAPQMLTFDETTVRQMLNTIDEGHNFSLLRAGYFSAHRQSPFPTIDGFDVLKSTLETQKPGDIKWFLLQAVRGSAAFHAPGIPYDDGFDAYNQIFDNVDLATTPRAQAAVRTAVRDFITINKENLGDSRAPKVLFKAWNVFRQLPPSAIDQKSPLDWARAVEAADAQDEFLPIVEKALKSTSPDFQTLKLAVIVLQNKDKSRAIELLKTAQQKLPDKSTFQEKWLYNTWQELITGNDPKDQLAPKITDKTQLAALVEMRQDQISYTRKGHNELLKLYWQLEENNKANTLITSLSNIDVAAEKINVAKVLLSPPRDMKFDKDKTAQLQEQGIAILQDYLSTENRLPNDEVHARYVLGHYFLKQDKITEAQNALNIDNLKPTSRNSMAGIYYQQILKLQERLKQKLENVPK